MGLARSQVLLTGAAVTVIEFNLAHIFNLIFLNIVFVIADISVFERSISMMSNVLLNLSE